MRNLVGSLLLASTLHLPAASFRNLSFEEGIFPFPVTPNTPGFDISVSDALPGWASPALQVSIPVNLESLGIGYTTLLAWQPERVSLYSFEGQFHLFVSMWPGLEEAFSLSQQGAIPSDTGFIQFMSYGSPWTLSIDGVDIPLTRELVRNHSHPGGRGYRNTGFVGDFADREVELRLRPVGTNETDRHGIDAIKFLPVPEPATLALMGLGGLLLLVRRRI